MLNRARRLSQICSLLVANSHLVAFTTRYVYTGPLKGFCVPILNCFACPVSVFACPIGALQHFIGLHLFPFYVVGLIGLFGITLGNLTCGWMCPFGFLQEMLFKLSKRNITLPESLGYIKYAVLGIFVIALPYMTGEAWFSKLCPVGTLTSSLPWLIFNPVNPTDGQEMSVINMLSVVFFFKVVILALLILLFFVSNRPFCKILCPLGAIFNLFNKISLLRMSWDPPCRSCTRCDSVSCKAAHHDGDDMNSRDCNTCAGCTDVSHERLVNIKTNPETRTVTS